MSVAEESKLDGNHIIVKRLLRKYNPIIETALCDTAGSGYAFIDENFARQHKPPKYKLRTPRHLDMINVRRISSGEITHIVKIFPNSGNLEGRLPAFITTLGQYYLAAGIPWLQEYDVKLDFAENQFEFTIEKCYRTCMKTLTKVD